MLTGGGSGARVGRVPDIDIRVPTSPPTPPASVDAPVDAPAPQRVQHAAGGGGDTVTPDDYAPKPRPRVTPRAVHPPAAPAAPTPTHVASLADHIPPFYFPYGRPSKDNGDRAEKCERRIRKAFAAAANSTPGQVTLEEMTGVAKVTRVLRLDSL